MTRPSPAFWIASALIIVFVLGLVLGSLLVADTKTIDSRTAPIFATVELAPSGQAYCPADPATPHPTPCLNKP